MTEVWLLPDGQGLIHRAKQADLPQIIRLYAEDVLGQAREEYCDPLPEVYYRAFVAILGDPRQFFAVLEHNHRVVGSLPITHKGSSKASLIAGLTHKGSSKASLEAVQVPSGFGGQELGQRLPNWAIAYARQRGARLAEQTSHKSRTDAGRFYQRLGFEASHGFKIRL